MAKPIKITILGDASGLERTLGTVNAGLGGLGKAALAAGTVVGTAAVAAGAALLKIGQSFDDAYDTIRVGTGATGAALNGLERDFKAVVRSVPTDFAPASQAIADLNARTGQTGKGLQDLAARELELARLTKSDLGATIAGTTRLFGDWGIASKDQAAALDKVFRASQATGIGIDRLSESAVQFGAPLRAMGFGFDQTLALLGKFEKEGVNTELVMGAMRKGLAKFAKDGEDAPKALARLVDEVKRAKTATEGTSKAIEVFGSKAGPDMAAAIREGRFDLGGLFDQVANGRDTIMRAARDTADFGEKWAVLRNRVFVGLEPLAARLFDAIGGGMDRLAPLAGRVTSGLARLEPLIARLGVGVSAMRAAFSGEGVTSDGFVGTMERVGVAARSMWERVRGAFAAIRGAVASVAGAFSTEGDRASGAVGRLASLFSSAFGAVRVVVETVVKVVTDLWQRMGERLLSHVSDALSHVLQVLHGAAVLLTGVFDLIRAVLTGKWGEAWEAVKTILRGAWEALTGLLKLGLEQLHGLLDAGLALLSAAWSLAWHAAWTLVKDVFGKVRDFLVRFWPELLAPFTGGLSLVVGAVADNFDKIVSGIKSVPGRIAAIASDFRSAAAGAGRAVIDGLGEGLSRAAGVASDIAGAVVSALKRAVNTVIDLLNDGIPDRLGWGPLSIDLPDNPIPHVRAMGGPAAGRVRVGERGPEEVELPRGSRVIPNHALTPAGAVYVSVQTNADPHRIGRAVAWALRTSGR